MPPKASKIQELKKKKKAATRTSPTSAPSSDQHDQNGTKSEERVDHDGTRGCCVPPKKRGEEARGFTTVRGGMSVNTKMEHRTLA